MGEKQKLPTDRSFPMYVLLDIITMHIYQAFMLSKMSKEINIVAQDGKKTFNYMYLWLICIGAGLLFALGFFVKSMIITKISYVLLFALIIFLFIWFFGISDRIGKELKRREVNYKFGASTFVKYFVVPLVAVYSIIIILQFCGVEENKASISGGVPAILTYFYFYKLIEAMNRLNKAYNETI